MITGRSLNSWGGHGLASWPQGKGGVPGQRKNVSVNIFFPQRNWGLSKQVCCENLKRKEILCLEAIAQRWQERYYLKYIHNVLLENLKESFLLKKKQPVYIQPFYTDEMKCSCSIPVNWRIWKWGSQLIKIPAITGGGWLPAAEVRAGEA